MIRLALTLLLLLTCPTLADETDFVQIYNQAAELASNPTDEIEFRNFWKETRKVADDLYGNFGPSDADMLLEYAKLYNQITGEGPTPQKLMAMELFKEYFRILEKQKTPIDDNYFQNYLIFVSAVTDTSFRKRDVRYHKKAMNIAEDVSANSHKLAFLNLKRAMFHSKFRERGNTRKYHSRALDLYEKSDENDLVFKSEMLAEFATYYLITNNTENAEQFAHAAINAIETYEPDDVRLLEYANHTLAKIFVMQEKPLEAAKQTEQYNQTMFNKLAYMPVFRANPNYPASAFRKRDSGWVEFTYDVNEQGLPKNIKVTASSSEVFERNAQSAVEQYRYIPRMENGKIVTVKDVKVRIEFRM